MDDCRAAGTPPDEATRLAGFGHDNVAAAQSLIESKKFRRVIRLAGNNGKDREVAAANRVEQGIARR